MITREQGLLTWASRWRTLTAWRRDLSEVKVEISNRVHAGRLGTCFSRQQRVVIYKGDSFVDELGTVLHELAHAATIGSAHDERWQAVYSAAAHHLREPPRRRLHRALPLPDEGQQAREPRAR